ncbi:hypothetical protein [Clostridium sp. DJ247]|uniref:hypothetical protein n=1 Tax=Clostridium sp. DJ247 TaxID=2726188 RepID=UPI0016258087|nr:hypothetical protein [Clostridium sp. DJ247]MBC2580833.1 hypothetical protein [Clostridium sp. DJ247]
MKKLKCFKSLFLIIILVQATMLNSFEKVYANVSSNTFKLIETIEKDTTGDGVNDKIKILADEKNQGYIVDITQHNGKTYALKSSRKNFNYISPYATFMKLNIIIADVNSDNIPEIVTWGSLTHENDIHIFQWDGFKYKTIFYGFYSGFYFKDITGDKVPELVIDNRLYGSGDESIYFQWQKDKYKKIYYDLVAGRGFDKIKDLIGFISNPGTNDYVFEHPESLNDIFTEEWINNKSNINYLKEIKSKVLSIQLLDYVDEKIKWSAGENASAIEDNWRIKVLIFKIDGVKVYPQEKIMEIQTKLTDGKKEEYKINNIKIR